MEIAQPRPPYVTFELQAEEDRAASIEAGHYVARDVAYAVVTPQGSKDRIPRRADEWFLQLEQQVTEGRIPREWVTAFRAQYDHFKAGREAPASGTPVADWPAITPAQLKALQQLHIRSVEDLANANEESINRLGMGARALKQKAIEWLAAAAGRGALAEELQALKQQNTELRQANTQLQASVLDLSAKMEQLLASVRADRSGEVVLQPAPPVAQPAAPSRKL